MTLKEEEFQKLTKLCHIKCSPEEKEALFSHLSKILSYAELLNEVGTEDIPPCDLVVKTLSNVLREDEIGPTLPKEQLLENSPSHIGGMIKVPSIFKTST